MSFSQHCERGPNRENANCSFCCGDATHWLIPINLEFGPVDALPSLCDGCTEVLSRAIANLPGSTKAWCLLSLELAFGPPTEEEEAI